MAAIYHKDSPIGQPEGDYGAVQSADSEIAGMVARYRALIEDMSFPSVARWKAEHPGGKAIGCFPVYTPEELITAAGMLPVAVAGGGNFIEIEHADSRLQSFICSISRSTLELGLSGRLQQLDGMIFPSTCDVSRNLSGVWQRNFPDRWVAYVHFPENGSSQHAVEYLVAELDRVRKGLEGLAGKAITEEDLEQAIALYNEHRQLIRELYAVKDKSPWLLSSAEAYILARGGSLLPREEHVAALRRVLKLIPRRAARARDRIRLILEGSFCEQPPVELIDVLEEAGCYIVNDDLWLASRWITVDIPAAGAPLERLARAYVRGSCIAAVRYNGPTVRRGPLLVEKCRQHRADGVVFSTAKFCDPALFDYALMKASLERANIPFLAFEFQEKMGTFESIRNQVETFVESILLFS